MDFSWEVPYPLGFQNANKPGKPSTSNSSCLLYGNGPVASSINKLNNGLDWKV